MHSVSQKEEGLHCKCLSGSVYQIPVNTHANDTPKEFSNQETTCLKFLVRILCDRSEDTPADIMSCVSLGLPGKAQSVPPSFCGVPYDGTTSLTSAKTTRKLDIVDLGVSPYMCVTIQVDCQTHS